MLKLKTAILAVTTTIAITAISCSNTYYIASSSRKVSNGQPRFINDIALTPSASSAIKTSVPSSHIKKDEKKIILNDPLCIKYANIMGVSPKFLLNAPLYNFIEEWYGVPYKYGGNDKSGIDCSAFVQRLYENVFGMDVVRTAFEQFNYCRLVMNTDSLVEGDLVFFYTVTRSRRNRRIHKRISHVGIYLVNDYFVHASSSSGVMISNLKENYWAAKFAGAGQVPKS